MHGAAKVRCRFRRRRKWRPPDVSEARAKRAPPRRQGYRDDPEIQHDERRNEQRRQQDPELRMRGAQNVGASSLRQ